MKLVLAVFLSLLLTGCISQNQADVKMGKGCAAGIDALIKDEGKQVATIKVERYASETNSDGQLRRVTIEAIEKDGWLELDKEYSCLFEEQWGPFKISHNAMLVQVNIDDRTIGRKDGKIVGNFEDFQRLSAAVANTVKRQ